MNVYSAIKTMADTKGFQKKKKLKSFLVMIDQSYTSLNISRDFITNGK